MWWMLLTDLGRAAPTPVPGTPITIDVPDGYRAQPLMPSLGTGDGVNISVSIEPGPYDPGDRKVRKKGRGAGAVRRIAPEQEACAGRVCWKTVLWTGEATFVVFAEAMPGDPRGAELEDILRTAALGDRVEPPLLPWRADIPDTFVGPAMLHGFIGVYHRSGAADPSDPRDTLSFVPCMTPPGTTFEEALPSVEALIGPLPIAPTEPVVGQRGSHTTLTWTIELAFEGHTYTLYAFAIEGDGPIGVAMSGVARDGVALEELKGIAAGLEVDARFWPAGP